MFVMISGMVVSCFFRLFCCGFSKRFHRGLFVLSAYENSAVVKRQCRLEGGLKRQGSLMAKFEEFGLLVWQGHVN